MIRASLIALMVASSWASATEYNIEGFSIGLNAGLTRLDLKQANEEIFRAGYGTVELQYTGRKWFISAQGGTGFEEDDDSTNEIKVDSAYAAFIGTQGFIDNRVMLQFGIGYGGADILSTVIATEAETEESLDGFAARVRGMELAAGSEDVFISLDYTHFFEDDKKTLSGISLGVHRLF